MPPRRDDRGPQRRVKHAAGSRPRESQSRRDNRKGNTTAGVEPFGGWIDSQGFPFGVQQAWAVTIYELIAPLFIVARRFVTLAWLGHIFILSVGLVLVHASAGWFAVGLGRNGVEYSVLLITCLIAVSWAHWPWEHERN